MMKRKVLTALSLILLVMSCIATVSALPLDTGNERVIHATGNGNIIGIPDRAQISLAIETENADVKIAQQDNAVRMNNVIVALAAAGIPRDTLKTTGYSIYPVYEESKTPFDQKIRTYRVTNTVTVTLHDVNQTGSVIDIAVQNGINQASSIRFMLSDEQALVLRTEALKKAVARAREDADTVATALGVTIVDIKDVEIGGGYSPVLFENYITGSAKAQAAPAPIQPGDVTVTVSVSVTYLIR
jgi:uncharacterized protein YggE